jgi:hypothetical protein
VATQAAFLSSADDPGHSQASVVRKPGRRWQLRAVASTNAAAMAASARKLLIVLEETHPIISETFSSGFDGETRWVVSRIGQIALQGRK